MLSFLRDYFINKFCYFFDSNCTRVKKFPENGHQRCPKSRSTKPFCENRRVTRYFAELFGCSICDTIYAVVKSMQLDLFATRLKREREYFESREKFHDLYLKQQRQINQNRAAFNAAFPPQSRPRARSNSMTRTRSKTKTRSRWHSKSHVNPYFPLIRGYGFQCIS